MVPEAAPAAGKRQRGTFVQQTAVAWLVLQLTGSAASLGLVLGLGGLPSLLFGPFGGGPFGGGPGAVLMDLPVAR